MGALVQFLSSPARRFAFACCVSAAALWQPLWALLALAADDNRYTHTVLMPLITVGLVWLRRAAIFQQTAPVGGFVAPAAMASAVACGLAAPNLPLGVLAAVTAWVLAFYWSYGGRVVREALVPLLFLAVMVPLPDAALNAAEVMMQRGSADATAAIFQVTGTPVFREGQRFMLPGLTVEVAQQCSGIRSSIGLVIATALVSYLFLSAGWTRAALLAVAIPITIFKNGMRIAILSWLGIYVSKDYLYGDLHHNGGPLFSLLSIALMLPPLLLLRRAERDRTGPAGELKGLDATISR